MPKELTPDQRAARNAYTREWKAKKRREAHAQAIAERDQRWARPAQQHEVTANERSADTAGAIDLAASDYPAHPLGSVQLEGQPLVRHVADTGVVRERHLRPPGLESNLGRGRLTVSEQPEVEEAVDEMALTQEPRAPEPEPIVERPEPTTPFDIYLSILPPETLGLLDVDELRKHFDDAEREAKAERRKQLAQQARDRAKESARAAAGLLTPEEVERRQVRERMSRRVKVTPTLPFVSDTGGVVAQGVTIDGVLYQNGQQATLPLGRALDMRHILYCLQQNELDFEGKGRLHGLRRQQAEGNNMVRI
jgi:hypothetical protein